MSTHTTGRQSQKTSDHRDDTAVLRVESLGVTFGGVAALRNVSFDLHAGESMAVIGPNGAGKTTLLNAICMASGLNRTGTVLYKGTQLRGRRQNLVKSGIVRSFQHPPLIEDQPVSQNVLMGTYNDSGYGVLSQLLRPAFVRRREREMRDAALEILHRVSLADTWAVPVSELSFGARKLIDIIRAALGGPDLFLLDEPTSGLDIREQEKVVQLLDDLRQNSNMSLLIVEHHMDFVRKAADTVIGLKSGELFTQGKVNEVFDSADFRAKLVS